MSTSKEQRLVQYCQTKNILLRNALFHDYMYLAEIISKKFVNRGIDYEDLYQVASLGLLEALERYDISRDIKFPTFATSTIVGKLKNYIRDKSSLIRIPRRNQELIHKIHQAIQALSQMLQRTPTVSEIGSFLHLEDDPILEAMEAKYSIDYISLDTFTFSDGEQNLFDVLGTEDASFRSIEDKDFLERCIDQFNDIEKTVIYERFYLEKTQTEVAKILGVSQMYISRLERKILKSFLKDKI